MIHVSEKKALNDFKEVRCARPRDLFARYGKRESIGFDSNLEEQVPMNLSKLDSIEYLENYDAMQASRQAGTVAELHDNDSTSSSSEKND